MSQVLTELQYETETNLAKILLHQAGRSSLAFISLASIIYWYLSNHGSGGHISALFDTIRFCLTVTITVGFARHTFLATNKIQNELNKFIVQVFYFVFLLVAGISFAHFAANLLSASILFDDRFRISLCVIFSFLIFDTRCNLVSHCWTLFSSWPKSRLLNSFKLPALARFCFSFLTLNAIGYASLLLLGYSYESLQHLNITAYCLILALVPRLAAGLNWAVERIVNKPTRIIVQFFLVSAEVIGAFGLTVGLALLMPSQFSESFRFGVSVIALAGTVACDVLFTLFLRGATPLEIASAQAPKAIQQQSE